MRRRASWSHWTLRDLLLAPVLVAVALVMLQRETPRVVGLAAAGTGLSVALAIAVFIVRQAFRRHLRNSPPSPLPLLDTVGWPSNSPAGTRVAVLLASRRKALAALAFASLVFPLWMATENELWRSSAAAGWLLPPVALTVLLALALRDRCWSPLNLSR